jgi:NADH-quinone oxidoreductase subunit H
MPVFWFLLKLLALLYATVWVRASLPRLRYDQLMNFGWKYLIEIAFVWIAVSGVVVVGNDQGWSKWITVPSAIGGAMLVLSVLWLCVPRRGELLEEIR